MTSFKPGHKPPQVTTAAFTSPLFHIIFSRTPARTNAVAFGFVTSVLAISAIITLFKMK